LLPQVKAANIADCVLKYRMHPGQVRSEHSRLQYEASARVRKGMLARAGVTFTDKDILLHEAIVTAKHGAGWEHLNRVARWFEHIVRANRDSHYWEEEALVRVFSQQCEQIGRHMGLRRKRSAASSELRFFLRQSGYRGEGTMRYMLRRTKRMVKRLILR
jgi:hypothetical protein